MTILNQPHRQVSFRFGEATSRYVQKYNEKELSLFESNKLLNDKMSSNEETLQIHKYWYRHDCILEKTVVIEIDFDAS